MNYLNVYKSLIEKRQKYEVFECFERHHILPKSLFPEYEKCKSNIVKLTYREHYVAHHLLFNIYKKADDKIGMHKMANAWMRMCINTDGKHVSQHEFEKARLAAVNANKNFRHSEASKKLISIHNANRGGLSDEHKAKIGEANKGKKHSKTQNEEHSKYMKEYYKTHDVWNKCIRISDESKKKNSEAHLGKMIINNGIINKSIFKWEQIPDGFKKGRIKINRI